MSRIYFHSRDDEVELRGSERAYMGGLTTDSLLWGLGIQRMDSFSHDRLAGAIIAMLDDQSYPITPQHLNTHLAVAREGESFTLPDGRSIDIWCCALNTLLVSGSDPMKLAARLHGQCEIHAFVEGPNREWLADIIEEGRSCGIFRSDQGWEGVTEFLRKETDQPVITSYSVCESFPDAGICVERGVWSLPEDHDGEPWNAWYDLSDEEQWDLGLKAIRSPEYGCELTPDHWEYPDMFFGQHPITAWQVAEAAWEKSAVKES